MGPKRVSCGRPSTGWSGSHRNWPAVAEDADPGRHNHCRPGKHHVAACRHSHADCCISNRCFNGGKVQVKNFKQVIISPHSNIIVVKLGIHQVCVHEVSLYGIKSTGLTRLVLVRTVPTSFDHNRCMSAAFATASNVGLCAAVLGAIPFLSHGTNVRVKLYLL